MSPTPLHSEFKVKAAPTGEPNGEPTGDPSVKPTMTIVARDDISNNGSQLLQDSEGALQQADSASEGAPQGTLVPIDCSIDTNIAPEVPIQK